ncbi:unnamed protein product [Closterium sp. NIES-65]|nr:unnamed protein product [Closterium sp. NIES-65]
MASSAGESGILVHWVGDPVMNGDSMAPATGAGGTAAAAAAGDAADAASDAVSGAVDGSRHYAACDVTFEDGFCMHLEAGGFVHLMPENPKEDLFVARIESFLEEHGHKSLCVRWYYRLQDLAHKPPTPPEPNELYYTTYYDVQHFEAVCREPCAVAHADTHSLNSQGAEENARSYVCKYVYVSEKGAFLPIKGAEAGDGTNQRQQQNEEEEEKQKPPSDALLARAESSGSSGGGGLQVKPGVAYEINASELPPNAPHHLRLARTVVVLKNEGNSITIKYPSPLSIRKAFGEYLHKAHLLSFWLLHPHEFPWTDAAAAGDACVTFEGSISPCAAAEEEGCGGGEQGEEIEQRGEGVGEGEGERGSAAAGARVMVSGGEGGEGEIMTGVELGRVDGEAEGSGGAAGEAFASVDEAAEALTQLKPCGAVSHTPAHAAHATAAAADDDDDDADAAADDDVNADPDADADSDADADCAVVETRSEDANGDATIEAEADEAEDTAEPAAVEAEAEEEAVDISAWPKRRRGGGGSRSRSKKARTVVVVVAGRTGSGNDASSLPSSASSGEDVEEEEAAVAVSRARGNGESKEKDAGRNGKKDAHLLKLPKDMQGRWSKERYRTAQVKLVDIMRAQGARPGKPMLRPVLREEARRYIGDTGLLDHLLKHMTDTVVPSGQRFRRRHNSEGAMEYWLEDAGLMAIRAAAGISDPTWVPPPGWKPGADPHVPCGTKRCHKVERDVERMGGSVSAMRKELDELRRQVGKLSSKSNNQQQQQQQLIPYSYRSDRIPAHYPRTIRYV